MRVASCRAISTNSKFEEVPQRDSATLIYKVLTYTMHTLCHLLLLIDPNAPHWLTCHVLSTIGLVGIVGQLGCVLAN
jgi:hypothetical protein